MLSRFSRLTILTALTLTAALAFATPALATHLIPSNRALLITPGSPIAGVTGMNSLPLRFSATAGQAVLVAESSGKLQALHRRMHPLHVIPWVWRAIHPYWYITFTYKGKLVADANVSPSGKLIGAWTGLQAGEPYTHGHLAPVLRSWWIMLPASLLFMLAFFDPRRLRRIAHLDALAVLVFLVSWLLLAQAHLASAVWVAYAPMVYLLVRLLRVGFAGRQTRGRFAPLLSTPVLIVGLPLLLAGRIVASILGHQEIDIGYESVLGAWRILHHLPMYYNDPNHGDTYGPFAYLTYVPFELVFPWKNTLSDLNAANYAAIVWDLGTVVGLVLLGRRLRPGAEGTRAGLVLAWAWAACPFTIIGVVVHTNDALVTMLCVFALLAFSAPAVSGALLGLAAATKFSPVALLPLLAAPRQRGRKGALVCAGTCLLVVGTAILLWLPPQGFGYFWQRTIGFQMTRPDAFSPWGLVPALHPLQILLEVFAVLLVVAVAFYPRGARSLVRISALAGAVLIAIQMPATHWFYYYIIWFMPFALVALLIPKAASAARAESEPVGGNEEPVVAGRDEPVLAGV